MDLAIVIFASSEDELRRWVEGGGRRIRGLQLSGLSYSNTLSALLSLEVSKAVAFSSIKQMLLQ